MRADARRNYELLLAVAAEAVAEHGADASLEQIARTAGVGSGTVRRHFPTRHALLEAVFRERIDALCAHAGELAGKPDPRAALVDFLIAITRAAATIRGLAEALNRGRTEGVYCASDQLSEAGEPLVRRAAEAGVLAPDVTFADLSTLVTGIALATENDPDPGATATRLLSLAMTGFTATPQEATQHRPLAGPGSDHALGARARS
ncbi:TetR family transcriptional regulator [Micromonospora echinospora]|uniref:Transcriptional regulator, TetR family n=1 Tax=Micromonospora echinospora TaxID=1877 RepID=A0A1C4YRD6_MICEC|nr:TetR/AcrR family transcriptional regulator [Micromonospora echinospora]OZV77344.1 TetR family transcriptional regulator [Micromonospora echinospora]SCF23319.1 transcriptional regulator, TetR family [Micromonospora echinospora]